MCESTHPRPLDLVGETVDWMEEHLPRQPDPELDKLIHPRGAKSLYQLGSGFVHGFKWLLDYVRDDSDLLEVTLECAVVCTSHCRLGRGRIRELCEIFRRTLLTR
jgi:hypothetical protein